LGSSGNGSVLSWNNGSVNGVCLTKSSDWLCVNLMDTNGMANSVGCVSGVFNSQWHHVAVTYDRVAGIGRIYVDGVIRASSTVGSFVPQTSYDLYFGQVAGYAPIVSGRLDEISLYQRPLNPEEINSIYASGSVGKCPSDLIQLVYHQPTVAVAAPPIITLPTNQLVLNGTVIDNGLPVGGRLYITWSQTSGPGTVSFAPQTATNALTGLAITNQLSTIATFSAPGQYVVRLTVDDTLTTNQVEVAITVNQAPVVNAGSDQVVSFAGLAVLRGTVQDDGLPVGAVVTSQWVQISGPGFVRFANAQSLIAFATFSKSGTYRLALVANDTVSYGISELTVTVVPPQFNQPPTVYAGINQVVGGTNVAALQGVVTDDNFFGTGFLGIWWAQQSGPGTVTFANSNAPANSASFSQPGTYVLVLSANDSQYTNSDRVTIAVFTDNMPPAVNPGLNQTNATSTANLAGQVTDDGLPEGIPLMVSWTKVSGPGSVFFGAAASAVTPVSFDQPGVYVLRLTADDSQYSVSSNVTITVRFNQAPQVSAGPDQQILNTHSVVLQGWASDDGLPSGSTLATAWSLVGGPGVATFVDAHQTDTTVIFSDQGTYQLRLTATDGELTNSDNVNILVTASNAIPYQATNFLYRFVSHMAITNFYNLDFDESSFTNGQAGFGTYGACIACSFNKTNYIKTYWPGNSGGTPDLLLRKHFYVPYGTTNLSMGFTVDNNAQIFINGVLITNADKIFQFGSPAPNALQSGWYNHEGCPNYDDLLLVGISTNVWHEGYNLLAVRAYDSGCEAFCDVRIGLDVPANVWENQPPVPITSDTQFVVLPAMADLTASVQDDGYPLDGEKTAEWVKNMGPGTVTFSRPTASFATNNDVSTMAAFSEPGTYTLQLAANDSVFGASAYVTVFVSAVSNQPPMVSAGADQTITLGDIAALGGTATDDGIPSGRLDTSWDAVSGPGNVYFFVIDDVTYADFDAIGDYVLRFSASDGDLTSASDVTVHVVSSAGRALRVSLEFPPATDRSIGADLGGTVFDDGQPAGSVLSVVWSSVSGPGAVAFSQVSSNFPNVSAHADFSIAGVYILRMTASDGELNTSVDAVINVTDQHNGNHAPVVNAGPTMTATTMSPVTLNGTASDDGLPAGGTLTTVWTQLSGPGTVFVGNPAVTNTTATFNAPGIYELQLTASDGQLSSSDYVTVMVTNSAGGSLLVYAGSDLAVSRPNAVWLEGMVLDGSLLPGNSPAYQWSKVSGPGTVTFDTVSNTTDDATDWLPVDNTEALASATFSADGSYVLRLSVTDTQVTNTDDITVTVYDAANLPPVAEIYAPEDGAIITAPTNIIGTASSPLLQSYQLQYRLKNPDDATPAPWTVFATGSSSVVNGPLGSLDPTLLLNGIYELQLVAADLMGRTASTAIQTFSVERNLKIGNFTLSFRDLNVPVSGIPIEIVRTYDSRDQRTNDFGIGWSLDIRNIRLQKTRSLGPNWYQYSYIDVWAGQPMTTYALDPMHPREITVTMAGDKVYHFQAVLSPDKNPGYPIEDVFMTFTNLPGTHGGLAIDGDNEALLPGSLGYVNLISYADFISDFNPTRFRFTNEVGDVYIIDEKEGLKSLTDRNQNTLIIATNGVIWTNAVTHNSGVGVAFVRDDQGRISQIIDPAGNPLNYAYGTNGSLASFTDRATNTTAFAYTNANFPHYLTGITDPRGNQAIRAEYDDNGRMVRQIDADNNVITFNHDFSNHREEITDRLNHTTIHYYDDRGNVVATIDALNGLTTSRYDDVDNLLEMVDALGNTNHYTYDGQGNKLTDTDPLGNTTRYTFGPYRALTSITTPRGFTTTNAYDPVTGGLIEMRDALGNATRFTYDWNGNLTTQTDALGNVTSNHYVGGRLVYTAVLDAQRGLLNETSFGYDTNGNQTNKTTWRTTSHGIETLTTSYIYDKENHLVQTINPDGSTNAILYTVGLSKPAKATDALGRQTLYLYDERGNETNVIYPDLTSESFFFDAENRKIAETDQGGRTTLYKNDPLGRVTVTVYPDGTANTNYYDPVGRTWAVVDALGHPTFYGYDVAGRNTSITNALNQVTRYEYDQSGNRVAMIDSLGRTNRFIYDALNHRVQTVFADNTTRTTWFDALNRRTYEQDQAGKVTAFGYNALGRLTSVTNAMGYVTSYAYDELGQQISQTDANLHTTTFEYDSLGRRVKRTLPDNQVETYAYNIGGQLTNKTDFNGYTTTYQYDQMNRLVAKLPDASRSESSVTFAYNTLGLRTNMTDASGATAYVYDDRNRLAQKTKNWGGSGVSPSLTSTLNYAYNANGNLTNIVSSDPNGANVGYEYDALSRLSAVDDTKSGQTVYNYDEVGNLKNYIYPNLVRSEYQYNSLNRLTNLASDKLLTPIANYAYTVGPAGNRLTANETIIRDPLNPVPRTINRVYSYDNLYRLTGETINGAPSTGSASYNYDPVGNRLARNSTLPELLSQSFTFDANDRLNTDTYDNNGNTLLGAGFGQTQTDQYDFENRFVTRHSTLNSQPSTINILYDGDGNRVSKTVTTATNLATTYYVVDDLNPSGYAQVLEEHVSLNSQPSTINTVYCYGHTLISQDRLDDVTWRTSFYGYDGHNNVRYLTDIAGNVTDTYDYDAFGNLFAQSSIYQTPTQNFYLYCGEQYDPDLGLYFLRARYVNTDTGRFWTEDAFEGKASDPTSLHKYTYCGNNPINSYDPSGNATTATLSELMIAQAIGVALCQTLAVVAVATYGAHYAGRDYTVYSCFGCDPDYGWGHAFMTVMDRYGSGWRYDLWPDSRQEYLRAKGNPWNIFEGYVDKVPISSSMGGIAIAKFNPGNLAIWESVIQGIAFSLQFQPEQFPYPFPYSYYLIDCYEWTAGATVAAIPISLLPFPNGFGHFF
jgi:RHS repeat-associated protein